MVIVILLLIALSFMFSGSEVAFFSLPRSRIKALKNRQVARILDYLISRPYTILSVILLGNTAVNAFAASIFSILIADMLSGIGEGLLTIVDVGIFTFILLVFGEITPKILALQYPLEFSSVSWIVVYPFYYLSYPVVKPLGRWIRKIFEGENHRKKEFEPVTLREAYNIVETAREILHIHELELLEDSVEFLSIRVSDIMTPRRDIKALPEDITIGDALNEMRKTRHSRFPVYKERLDDITGILDLLSVEGILNLSPDTPIRSYLLEPVFVPETMRLPELVRTLVETPVKMAIVTNEYGGTEGVVTLKDAYKHFMGKIRSEFESEELEEVKKIGDRAFILSGDVSVSVLEKLTGRRFIGYYGSISNLILDNIGHVPTEGEKVEINGIEFEILAKEGEYPEKVKVTVR